MPSSFAGVDLFSSGPHRMMIDRTGRFTLPPFTGPNQEAFTRQFARRDLKVIQTGRLIAASDAALWALSDAIQTRAEQPQTGTLIDNQGRAWTAMTMIDYQPLEPFSRGRVVSLPYRIIYIRWQ